MKNAVLSEKLYAGNPHVQFDAGDVASYPPTADRPEGVSTRWAKPRRGALLYKIRCLNLLGLIVFSVVPHLFAFAEEPYVQATGTQHINTHYYPKATTRIEVDFETTEAVKNGRMFGCSGDLYFDYTNSNDDNNDEKCSFQDDTGGWWNIGVKQTEMIGVRRTVIMDGPGGLATVKKHDGTVLASCEIRSSYTKDASCPLGLFIRIDDAEGKTGGSHAKAKLYGVKIYESGVLIHDLQPHLVAGEPGLKDAVTGEFLNANKLLKYGGDITSEDVAYIESTGEQVLDTGYFVGPKTRIEFDCAAVEGVKNARFFGCCDTGKFFFSYYTENKDTMYEGWCYRDDSGNYTIVTPNQSTAEVLGQRRKIIMDGLLNLVQVVDPSGAKIVNNVIDGAHTATSTVSLALFGRKNDSSFDRKSKIRVFGVKIYEDGVLLRDYRPALKNGKAGLFELCAGKFLTSSTDFNYGGSILDVTVDTSDDAYLESHGRQIITTDAFLSSDSAVEIDYMTVAASGNSRVFGCRDGMTYWDYCTHKNNKNELWSCQDGSTGNFGGTSLNTTDFVGIRRTVVMDSFGSEIRQIIPMFGATNVLVSMETTRTATSSRPLEVFSVRTSDTATPDYSSTNRIYAVRVYEKGSLVHDYRPCLEFGKPGFRDEFTSKFFSNTILTDGDLTYGGNISRSNDTYVETDGTSASVLDTGYFVKPTTRVEIECAAYAAIKNARFFGCRDADNLFFSYFTRNNDDMKEGWCFQDDSGNYTMVSPEQSTASLLNCRRTISLDGEHLSIYDRNRQSVVVDANTARPHTKTSRVSLALFGMKNGDSLSNASKIRIYRCRIFEGNGLKHDFIPCEKDGQVGFYDLIGKTTIGKASGLTLGEGSADVDGTGSTFLSVSPDCTVSEGDAVTLHAFADGKVDHYEWRMDGVLIDDVTSGDLTVSWKRRKTPIECGITPVYVVEGREIRGAERKIFVACARPGLAIIVR